MKIHIVAGQFNDCGGKPSGWANKLACILMLHNNEVTIDNGGTWDSLTKILDGLPSNGIVLWFADVPNDKPKIVSQIKQRHSNIYLVTSKRNLDNQYSVMDLVARALAVKANLLIEFTGSRDNVSATILDPLGNAHLYQESDISIVAEHLTKRLDKLRSFRRIGTSCLGDAIIAPESAELLTFMGIVKLQADKFHNIIHGVNTARMLGNASFRCTKGFPSFRVSFQDTNQVFVSRRNVDKRNIAPDEFIAVRWISKHWNSGLVGYYGPNKPSVDTPVQLALYDWFPNVNYMLHSHTYIDGAPMTSEYVPCGAMEEVLQIWTISKYNHQATNFCVNVRGHGSIVLAEKPSFIKDIKWTPRPVPEIV